MAITISKAECLDTPQDRTDLGCRTHLQTQFLAVAMS